jgi:hypothetical protein
LHSAHKPEFFISLNWRLGTRQSVIPSAALTIERWR